MKRSQTKTKTQAAKLQVRVTRVIDQELEWYFSHAESALRRQSVGMLPGNAAIRLLVTEPTEEAVRVRAFAVAHPVRSCLRTLRPRHAEVLRAVYTRRVWPSSVIKAFAGVSAIAVRMVFAEDPWPQRGARGGLEIAAASQLSSALIRKSVSVAELRSGAERLLKDAVVAYAGLRALERVTPEVG